MTKIRARVGEVEVEYEGPEAFLDKKLPELISQLSKLSEAGRQPRGGKGKNGPNSEDPGSLASFLHAHDAGKNQLRRFLATAQWLHLKGTEKLKTGDVVKALKDNHQSRLANASDCLNKNVSKGLCEKDGTSFFVTPEGQQELA